jgi:hypothetical protein
MPADCSAHARAGAGYDKAAFTIDWAAQQATCPQGKTSTSWSPALQRGTPTIVVTFPTSDCGPCPVRDQCTTSKKRRRQLTIRPQQIQQALDAARTSHLTHLELALAA